MTGQTGETEAAPARRRFQYGLRALFALTTAVAIACAVYFASPPAIGALADFCLIVFTPLVLTTAAIYGRGNVRTLSVGALLAAAAFLCPAVTLSGLEIVREVLEEFVDAADGGNLAAPVFIGIYYFVLLGTGLLAVYVRRVAERLSKRGARAE